MKKCFMKMLKGFMGLMCNQGIGKYFFFVMLSVSLAEVETSHIFVEHMKNNKFMAFLLDS